MAQIDFDWLESCVRGLEPQQVALAVVILDGGFIAEARDDDLAVADLSSAMNGEDVAIVDVGVEHAQAMHAQQEIGARPEQRGIEQQFILDVILRQRRYTRRHPAVERQSARQREGGLQQADIAGDAGFERDEPLARERAQVLVDSLAIAQAHGESEISAGRRPAVAVQELLDQLQHLALAGAGLGGSGIHGQYHTFVWYRFKAGSLSVLGLQLRFPCQNNA